MSSGSSEPLASGLHDRVMDRQAPEPEMELCWGTVMASSLEEFVSAAAAAGFRSVTVSPPMCSELVNDSSRLRSLRQLLSDERIEISVIDPLVKGLPGLGLRDALPARHRNLLEASADDCCRLAVALGANTVNIAHVTGGPVPQDELVEALASLASKLGQSGLRGAIEFIPGTGMPDLESTVRLLQAVGASNLGLTFDTWHFNRSGGTLEELAQVPPAAIIGLQINDAPSLNMDAAHRPGTERLLPGAGKLPLSRMLPMLLNQRPRLRVGVEVFSDELHRMPPAQAAAVAYRAGRQVVTEALRSGPAA